MILLFYSINNTFANISHSIYFNKCNGNILVLMFMDLSAAACNTFDHSMLQENYTGLWSTTHLISGAPSPFLNQFLFICQFHKCCEASQFSLSPYFNTIHKQCNQCHGSSLSHKCNSQIYICPKCIFLLNNKPV